MTGTIVSNIGLDVTLIYGVAICGDVYEQRGFKQLFEYLQRVEFFSIVPREKSDLTWGTRSGG